MIVSPMTMKDYDAMMALWQACQGVGLSDADSPQNINRYLERNPGMSFVAEVDGRLIGAALSGHDGRRGYIHHLAVHPDYRRRGIGKELIKHCLAALAADGIQKCHLYVFTKNQDGIRFWEDTAWTRRDDLLMMSHYTDANE